MQKKPPQAACTTTITQMNYMHLLLPALSSLAIQPAATPFRCWCSQRWHRCQLALSLL